MGLKALLSLVAMSVVLPATGVASMARAPLLRAHPRPPFGSSYRPVCGPVPAGRVRCLADIVTVGSAPNGAQAEPLVGPTPLGYGPADLQDAYGIVSEAASEGATQTVAIADAYDAPNAESDLATYRSQYGLSACTTANGCFRKVDQRGGSSYPPANAKWAGEISLDLDAVSAICPHCRILLVEADSSFSFDLAASVNEAAALGATQISNSYGGPESASQTNLDADYNHPGVAVTASSGDSGYGVEYPASSRYVTAVGGTSLAPAPTVTRGWAETAWSGAGSGCSQYEAKPSWQSDIGCSNRTVADVSAVADPATGAAVYSSSDGGWVVYGGTSLASPIVAAYDALIGSAAASAQYPYAHLGSIFDVVSGSNGPCGTYLCTAGAGYDGPTGVGAPHGAGLQRAPTVGTESASAVTGTAETLKGTVNPQGSETKYQFEYGTSISYGSTTTTTVAGSDSSVHSVSATVSSLSASTRYHFRISATSSRGTRVGTDNIFTTGAGPPPPTNTVRPHVVGLAEVGAVLTVSTGTWTGLPNEYAYQWWRCLPSGGGGCAPSAISGATASTYTVGAGDLGGEVYVVVRAHNANGWAEGVVSDNSIAPIRAPVPANTAAPHVTGASQVGSTLSVSPGTWTGAPSAYGYQWWRCRLISGGGCSPSAIGGATSSAYALAAEDVGAVVWGVVRAQNANGWSSFVNSDNLVGPVTSVPRPANTARPHVSGDPLVGSTLSASPGAWSGSPDSYEYEWLECIPVSSGGCVPSRVGGASASYVVGGGDLNRSIYVAVRAHNGGGWSSFVVSGNEVGPISAPPARQATLLAPSITRLSLRPVAFRAARRGASVAVATGARVTFTLSRAAYVTFTVERVLSGRRVGGRCVAPGAGNRRRPSCTRYVTLKGSFRYPGSGFAAAGARGFKFTGRLAGRSLTPGSYRLVAVALGAAGPRSSASRSAFRIVR